MRVWAFITRVVVSTVLIGAFSISLAAEPAATDAGARVTFQKKGEKTRISGKVTSSDESGFELLRGKEETLSVKWADLDPTNIFAVRSVILAKGTASEWMKFGMELRSMDGGEKVAEKAFSKAIRVDPKIKTEIEKAKKDADQVAFGVHSTGKGAWPTLSEEESKAAIKELNDFAAEAKKKLNIPLALNETKYFLFYSDIPPAEAKNWASLLDKMYARLADLFAVPKGENIWHGKAIVFVFSKAEDYRRFEFEMHGTDSGFSAGMCHSSSLGWDHIAFYRQPDELVFAHVLVHESVHGFIHRYRTSASIANWANEGLAEVIASELVPQNGRSARTVELAKSGIKSHAGLEDIFEKTNILAWQYPVAETLCSYMIQQNKKGYVSFIVGMKEGLTDDESLETKFKMKKEALVAAYGQTIGIKDLKP